ncbi:TonB-like protein [Candidatus Sulfotelmatobacter kueseliae]|uniref:TonB-like protein n=1 Tax=Candidatus Sulfotelmatobacter kueseliae TaxID=2042962 RepID=A0A2U3KU49_9BACT|nr:TonB-like protein [Candidatus Sulfotelmatobacter kueseliae]
MGSSVPAPNLFSSLPRWKTPWSEFVFGYGVQVIAIAILVWIPVLHPEVLDPPARDYHAIELVPTPVPVNHAPQQQLPKPVLVAEVDPPTAALRLPAPQPKPKAAEDAPAPQVKIPTRKMEPLPPSTAPVIPKAVRTNVFSTGSSAPQTIERAAEQVQTGGFGDPNGVPAKLNTGKSPVNIAQAGGFDLPTGPGYGNGTGGANGARGVVASAGFGGGAAVQTPSSPRGTVHQAGFGDADVPAPPTVQARPAVVTMTPAEIISKPTPVYTAEARAKRIEGEVLLEVTFEASGKIEVLRVIRGLGYGLDDAAIRAAEQIRFKPALQDGRPSDSTAVLHIIFQLT